MGRTKLGVALATTCLVAACTGGGSPSSYVPRRPRGSPTSSRTVLIGLVGTMSGDDEWRGTDAFEGAHFGIGALNRNIENGGPAFELITRDDRGDPQRAADLVAELASDPRYAGIVYAGPTEGLPHAETILEEAGIPAVLCYGDLYSPSLLRSNMFQVSPPLDWEGEEIGSYIARDRKYVTTGALVERSLDGKTAVAALQAGLGAAGAARATVRRYSIERPGLRAALGRLRKARVEAVVVQGRPSLFDQVAATLKAMRASYVSTASARFASAPVGAQTADKRWRPQLLGFDGAIHSTDATPAGGTVAADSYERGLSYLPVPSFRGFRTGFVDWWGHPPLGWQVRAYEAVQMIGWAKLRTDPGGDAAATLERLHRQRFGGLDITLSSADHVAVERQNVGLWTIPRPGADVPERDRLPASLEWVPLARSFTTDGSHTSIPSQDWPYLFRAVRPGRPPSFAHMRFGVTTGRKDPVH